MTVKPSKARPLIVTLDRARSGPTPDDPRRLRTRTALIEAAQKLFSERTFEAISVEYITEAAGVAKGSFYNHFSDKHELATEIGSLLYGYVTNLLDQDALRFSDPAVRCARGTMIMLRFSLEHQESARALLRLSRDLFSVSDPLNSRVMSIVKAGIEDGSFTEIGVEDGFMVMVGIAQMVVQQAVDGGWTEDIKTIAQRCSTSMLRAFGLKLPRAKRLSESAAEDLLHGI